MMGINVWLMIVGAAILTVVIGIIMMNKYRKRQALLALDMWLDEYRSKVSVDNRILCNRLLIGNAFPEYSHEIHGEMWRHAVSEGWVRLDERDKEWVVAP